MIMRGGTSKGAYFLDDDLPSQPADRDRFLLQVMGTPDPRQIDGIGGAHPLTSKVAVVGHDHEGRGDVAYLFLQTGVGEAFVSDRQYCGNILAGVGPFAVERGLVEVEGSEATVTIHMLNFDSYATATFPIEDGAPVYSGGQAISGVPGTAARVNLEFEGLAGASTGALLPAGSPISEIDGTSCTLIDNGMPVVVLRASDLGVTGHESCADLEANDPMRSRLESLRLEAGQLMNLGDVSQLTVPKVTLVAPPREGGHLATRTFIPHRCHQAIGVLGAVSVATAALIPGSVAFDLVSGSDDGSVLLEHPTGTFQTFIHLSVDGEGSPVVERVGIVRTARKLMDGVVFPRAYD
jgi:4-oxalomesaconate tautomerase